MKGQSQILQFGNQNHLPNQKQEFMYDVLVGLSKVNKEIQSKYFYDERGGELFNQITRHPDYYLTECELEILNTWKKELSILLKKEPFNLVELGPGEGIKTCILIDQFLEDDLDFSYCAIDICKKYLTHTIDNVKKQRPNLEAIALNSDYLTGIKWLSSTSKKRNFLLFLGSSIGNFNLNATKEFLRMIRSFLHPGDLILIGFDLLKDIDMLKRAYNDKDGITREFNLNLLKRMNDELGANFNINAFQHHANYNVHSQAMESFLLSSKEQIVYFESLKKSFGFKKYEPIHVESSQKYLLSHVENLAHTSKFKLVRNFTDSRQYFLNSLWGYRK
jgi:L-histidine Nalpha-methyltransferase